MSARGTKVNARMLALLLLPIVFLVATLTLVLRDWVRDAIVTPILFILWLGGLLIKSTPQWVFWAVFLVMALLILANSLGTGRDPIRRWAKRSQVIRDVHVCRFGLCKSIGRLVEILSPTSSAEPLRRLVLEVMAFQERLSLREVEQRLEFGELDVPPVILAYLQNRLTPELYHPVQLLGDAQASLGRLCASIAGRRAHALISGLTQTRSQAQPSPFDGELESVVQFLEDRLEIKHDD